ncbi:MAG: polyketide synthase dehydratase domain-containing protein, partial [Myxococcota bacterium]|nr:polyketide synthase dehydratase domain-containing protein [Myxococcota bacterium]
KLHVLGYTIQWETLFEGRETHVAELPTYAFQRKRYWLDPESRHQLGAGIRATDHPILGGVSRVAGTEIALYSPQLSRSQPSWVGEHVVLGETLLPGTALMELMRAAGEATDPDTVWELTAVTISAPLTVPPRSSVSLQVTVEAPGEDGGRGVRVYSARDDADEPWLSHAEGRLTVGQRDDTIHVASSLPPDGAVQIAIDELYRDLDAGGLRYGPTFQGLREAWRLDESIWAKVELGGEATGSGYGLHPALLDAAFHAMALAGDLDDADSVYLPFALERLRLFQPEQSTVWVRVQTAARGRESVRATLALYDLHGMAVAELDGLQLKRADVSLLARAQQSDSGRHRFGVTWEPLSAGDSSLSGRWLVRGIGVSEQALRALVDTLMSAGAEVLTSGETDSAWPDALAGVCVLWGSESQDGEAAHAVAHTGLLELQATVARERVKVAWVTQAAMTVGDEDLAEGIALAPLWGMARSTRSENPDLDLVLIDHQLSLGMLPQALRVSGEPELAIRDGELFAPRLGRAQGALVLPSGGSWRIEVAEKGRLDKLEVVTFEDGVLEAGEARVRIEAAGINFRDVLNALGMVPIPWLGLELAGVVTEVADDVTHLQVGDRVLGMAQAAFASTAKTDARLLTPIADSMSFEEAATVPLVFLTAWYALYDLGKMQPGERVLIHAAAGGVGMAAVQIAKLAGAEIFGTASQPKWQTLRELGLDEARIASSRHLEFAESYRDVTDGEGVDIVLNALAREFIDASLGLLREGGRFLEMGKTDVRDQAWLDANYPGLYYNAFDLMEAGYDRIQEMLSSLSSLFAHG